MERLQRSASAKLNRFGTNSFYAKWLFKLGEIKTQKWLNQIKFLKLKTIYRSFDIQPLMQKFSSLPKYGSPKKNHFSKWQKLFNFDLKVTLSFRQYRFAYSDISTITILYKKMYCRQLAIYFIDWKRTAPGGIYTHATSKRYRS